MKKHLLFAASAILAMTVFTSCSKQDNAAEPTFSVVTFENQKLNDQGFWCGTAEGSGYSYDDGYGGVTTTYPCVYAESGVKFNTNYSVSTWGYDYWSGFAISSRTQTTFSEATLTPDQYNNITGKANSGEKFCVVTTYGETIDIEGGAVVKGFYFTNSAYTVEVIKNGNSYAHKFDNTDWLTCTVVGTAADNSTKTVDIKLAENGTYVNSWQWADLSSLGKVVKLEFVFTGSDSGDYGVNTPAYICIDDMAIEK